ncbi:LOW QUALITY PROTEIN: hypothetical protein PAHAL_9G079100 [Panicum hallii]|uniref:Ig-like domain-containing protein n=1 Tax=Panicum hallii TaxID=206008 RepID=A0A2S3IHV8_9POAL|nr:LOW QUALITY PROTEIN: hypothetical protein PAHAL_9G079100 [Panicum hallii]
MDPVAYIAILSLVLLFLLHRLLGLASRNGKNKSMGLPPSPPAIPFLGHLHLVKTPFHAALARSPRATVFSMRMGSRRAVVVSSPDAAKECFTEHDVAFANRPLFPSQKLVSFGGNSLSMASYGPYWRNLRRVAAVQLLSAHRVACMSPVISAEVRAMMKRRLFEVSLSVLMETIARTKTSRTEADADTDMSPEAQVFKQIVNDIVPHLGTANLWDYLPVLRWFDVFGVINKLVAAVSRRDVFLRRLIDAERRREAAAAATKSEPEVYTDTMIKSLCASMFGAGTETTSTTTEWAMALLLNHPEKLQKAQAEIYAAVGTSSLITPDDVPRLNYLQSIITETLRLYPAAPLLLPHESSADCTVGGYDVPRGTMLLVNVYAVFWPERFEDGKAEGRLLMPFGMGRLKCPGETFALRTVGLVLGSLLQCFDWDRVDGAMVDMTESGGLTIPMAVPLEAMCRPRAAMHDVLQELWYMV